VRALRLGLGALGVLVMAYAVGGAVADRDDNLVGHLAFLVGVQAAHDAVVLPVAVGVGALLRRYVREPAIIQGGLVVTVAVLVVGLPLALGYGRAADNPSALPLNYPLGLLLVLATVWLAAALFRRSRRRRLQPPRDDPGQ